MRHHPVAHRYADALFALARESGKVEAIDRDLQQLVDLIASHEELTSVLASPVIAIGDKKLVVWKLFNSHVDAIVLNTLLLMIDKQRADLLPQVQTEFRKRVDDLLRRTKATIRTAFPLESAQAERLRAQLEAQLSRHIELEVVEDPGLIGGLTVTVGDRVLDASLRGRLEALARTLA
jgi:F-type H+-transporting ATPase subunit delta